MVEAHIPEPVGRGEHLRFPGQQLGRHHPLGIVAGEAQGDLNWKNSGSKGSVLARTGVETHGKGSVLATTGLETQGKDSVSATKGVETMKGVETQGKGSVLATKGVKAKGKGSVIPDVQLVRFAPLPTVRTASWVRETPLL